MVCLGISFTPAADLVLEKIRMFSQLNKKEGHFVFCQHGSRSEYHLICEKPGDARRLLPRVRGVKLELDLISSVCPGAKHAVTSSFRLRL